MRLALPSETHCRLMKQAVKSDEKHLTVLSDLNHLVGGVLATCFGIPEVKKNRITESRETIEGRSVPFKGSQQIFGRTGYTEKKASFQWVRVEGAIKANSEDLQSLS